MYYYALFALALLVCLSLLIVLLVRFFPSGAEASPIIVGIPLILVALATLAAFLVIEVSDQWIRNNSLVIGAVLIGALIVGAVNRLVLSQGMERELSGGPIKLGRKIRMLCYESVLLTVIIVLLAAASAIVTYLFASRTGYNPFNVEFTLPEAILFFVDQAAKGAFFDIAEVFELHLQRQLTVDARRYVFFGLFLVAFRIASSFILIGGLTLLFYQLFIKDIQKGEVK